MARNTCEPPNAIDQRRTVGGKEVEGFPEAYLGPPSPRPIASEERGTMFDPYSRTP